MKAAELFFKWIANVKDADPTPYVKVSNAIPIVYLGIPAGTVLERAALRFEDKIIFTLEFETVIVEQAEPTAQFPPGTCVLELSIGGIIGLEFLMKQTFDGVRIFNVDVFDINGRRWSAPISEWNVETIEERENE